MFVDKSDATYFKNTSTRLPLEHDFYIQLMLANKTENNLWIVRTSNKQLHPAVSLWIRRLFFVCLRLHLLTGQTNFYVRLI